MDDEAEIHRNKIPGKTYISPTVAKRDDGKLINAVIDTYENVSQFGNMEPEEYLKQPPFSRSFQGIAT